MHFIESSEISKPACGMAKKAGGGNNLKNNELDIVILYRTLRGQRNSQDLDRYSLQSFMNVGTAEISTMPITIGTT